ncbi:zf-HC2 domain-containing protein [Sphingomonas sp. GV3]|uniref:zf-HC2 domain-containing protein n=1 Tax=Sphingomonas sp. GV3 TaxID=3040671 RepID=UPI00280BED60|nr:zf-HC2 domain-containing protein [Sphingomonas sp. GV3]
MALLLPWHAAGTLDSHDAAIVERHLAQCERCRADLVVERRLVDAIAADGVTADGGWFALDALLDSQGDKAEHEEAITIAPLPPRRMARSSRRRGAPLRALSKATTLRWVVGGQFAALLVLGTIVALPLEREGPYRALGEAPATGTRPGNTLAMFRPNLSEAALRRALIRVDARVVDGPTAAGAYVLNVPGGATGPQLAILRAQPGVTMAEPVGEGAAE